MPSKKTKPLLRKGERRPIARVNSTSRSPVLIVCDHAGKAMPRALKNLGLTARQRAAHIAWDPGTATIGRALARALNAPAMMSVYSRLVVDLNRGEDHPDCMRDTSDGVSIPGNRRLSATEKEARLRTFHRPYHEEIDRRLDATLARGETPLLISVHSFTPRMNGQDRPWHIGVMWDRHEKLAKRFVTQLRRDNPALVIGENAPYSLKKDCGGGNTIARHCDPRGLPYLIFEIRQDLVGGSAAEARAWADVLLRSLRPLLADPKTYRRSRV